MITSAQFTAIKAQLEAMSIDINDAQPYWNGVHVSVQRNGHAPVNGLAMFKSAVAAREQAEALIRAADAMDLRISQAISAKA